MSKPQAEAPYTHGSASKTALLFCNLGTPDAPTAPALRRYLAQFLSDPRVVEIPRIVWGAILHGIILRVRPAKSAAKYAGIWTREGSPLKVWTEKQAKLLQGQLGERGHKISVRYAMRYGQPAIASTLSALRAEGVTRVLVLPAYPQYSGATTASVVDDVARWALKTRHLPELRFVTHYHDEPLYIAALADSVRRHWAAHGRPEKLVMSFHGMPARSLALGDPYHCECLKTGRLLAESLGLSKTEYEITFQSRFGKAKWLEPYTEPTLKKLAADGLRHVAVICPGFSADCLETLEEINLEAREAFLHAGGQRFDYIPCLNDDPAGMRALSALAERHLQGWPTQETTDAGALQRQRERALAQGAKV
ncbi:ferrochelatase [Paucibacter oligotrophus]|uniref:Ferrochelatase n=1 Tax=Roseateles oligotrophus TaxID=1769250 RepID=A0A840L9L1_9BURK|nr:ferrochelatase [Roseateles oligotrophus]MBB4842057.1 ferrochelatase [Roseateles oligotrophus]